MQKPLADQRKEEAALLPWEAQPEWKGKRVQKHYLGRKSLAHLFSKASLGRIPFSLPVGHSSSPFSLPGEGFLKQSTNLALPPRPPTHTPLLKILQWLPFAHGWTRSRPSSTIIHGLSDSSLRLAVQPSSCLPICYALSRFSPSPLSGHMLLSA